MCVYLINIAFFPVSYMWQIINKTQCKTHTFSQTMCSNNTYIERDYIELVNEKFKLCDLWH